MASLQRRPPGARWLTTAAVNEVQTSLHPLFHAAQLEVSPALTPPLPPVLAALFGLRFRYLSIAAGLLLSVAGLLLLLRRHHLAGTNPPTPLQAQPHRQLAPATPRRISSKNAKEIAQLRADLEDAPPFLREIFTIMVRSNPINLRMVALDERLESITQETDRKQVCQIVKSAIEEVQLAHVVEELGEFDAALKSQVEDTLRSSYDDLALAMPDYRQRLPQLPDLAAAAQHSGRLIGKALLSTRPQLALIEQHYHQLIEHLPRYEKLMNRSGLLGFFAGLTAALLVDEDLASAGAELWDGWREQSDEEFSSSFSRALDQFSDTAVEFTLSTEKVIIPVVRQTIEEHAEAQGILIDGLERLATDGYDIGPVYREFHKPISLDVDTTELFELIFSNLREQGMSGRSERNLRSLFKMT